MPLLSELSDLRGRLQDDLFPHLEESLGPLGPKYRQLVTVLEMVPVSGFVTQWPGGRGRPPVDRVPLARAFTAKTVFNIPTTTHLIERLQNDKTLRRLCGWHRVGAVPGAHTFSRAFAEFAASELPSRMHEGLIVATHKDRPQGPAGRPHLARLHRHRGAREAGEGESPQALPQQAAPAEGRARLGDRAPARAPAVDDAV